MITEIQIENFKSIHTLKINLGRVNVFIGENGCGKSNILEAIALASAASANKLDNEFLAPRGIRVVEPQFMRSAFEKETIEKDIIISLKGENEFEFSYELHHDNQPYSKWENSSELSKHVVAFDTTDSVYSLIDKVQRFSILFFLIYTPENTSLRKFDEEGQIQPLGIKGEGLFKLLRVLNSDKNPDRINEIKTKLKLLDWFDDFEIPQDLSIARNIQIKDRYLDDAVALFDQRSSNEGFLFLLFYFTLFISDYTPKFFAIDNIDASLNPKLCTRLIKELVQLAKKHDKQVILTTHNPAILDGLNLDDDDQRLFVIHRNLSGHTKAKRIFKPQPLEGQKSVKLSESFMRGYIGGLPEGF
jgi:AAA15 family ATPase/GTPase